MKKQTNKFLNATLDKYLDMLGGRTIEDICYDEEMKKFIPMYSPKGIYRDYIPERYTVSNSID